MKQINSKISVANRRHPVLLGRAAKLLGPFRLKMTDLTEEVPYLVDNALHLPERLTSKQIRQIGVAARMMDRSGFSLGDLLVWLKRHPDAPITHDEFVKTLLYTGLSRRSIYNYQSLSKVFPVNERQPGLSRPRHSAVNIRGLPKREKRKLLQEAFTNEWTDEETALQARIRKQELAMPADSGGEAASRSPILRNRMLLAFEKSGARNARVVQLLSKPSLTTKEAAALEREVAALLKQITDAKELLSRSPVPLK